MRWLVDFIVHRQAARQAPLEHEASLALWHSDRETWLAQHPDFDPTDPTHADPSGRPVFNAITARGAPLGTEGSPRGPCRWGVIAGGGTGGPHRGFVGTFEASERAACSPLTGHQT